MPLAAGTRLGPYEIVSALGAGGMGEVYKGRDTRLDRMVAIKVLPADKVADPERKQRFVQEAKAASALNHPNIVTIHDISADNGIDFLVMEYVPGKSLDSVIPAGGLPAPETVKYAVQIADAFAAAHAAGIVHRDLKPANVMITSDGRVKVLDFGLAKLTGVSTGPLGPEDKTMTARHQTEEGAIVGTIAYMSPEQAEGKPVDTRSDIFSFGSVLYEMLTGQKAFEGDSKLSILSAILRQEPKPLAEVVGGKSQDLDKIAQRCLRKDRDRRFQSMADLKVALMEAQEYSASGVSGSMPAKAKPRASRLPVLGAAVLVLLLALAGAWWKSGRNNTPSKTIPFTSSGTATDPAFSPDGKLIAFVGADLEKANYGIYVQQTGAGNPLRLTTDPAPAYSPAFSPDGRYIAFIRKATLVVIPTLGGAERQLCKVGGFGVDFSPDGKTIAAATSGSPGEPLGIFLVSVETGQQKRLTSPPSIAFDMEPRFSPDGKTIAFNRSFGAQNGEVDIVSLDGGAVKRLSTDNRAINGLAWMPGGGEIVYSSRRLGRPDELWSVSASGGTPQPVPVAGEHAYHPAISRTGGRLAYVHWAHDENVWHVDLTADPLHPSGTQRKLIASTWLDVAPQYSPDGMKIAFASDRSGGFEIWICNADGSAATQLTFLDGHSGTPRWSPDGHRIVFDANLHGKADIFVVNADGGAPRPLSANPPNGYGRSVPSWSFDGRWIYFTSNRSGRTEIWRASADGGQETQLTHQGGFDPRESPDGRHLYYLKRRDQAEIWSVGSDGGTESPVLTDPGSATDFARWQPFNEGIYLVSRMQTSSPAQDRIQFFNLTTKSISVIARPGKPVSSYGGFSVSADRRHLIFAQSDQDDRDIMLVENFH